MGFQLSNFPLALDFRKISYWDFYPPVRGGYFFDAAIPHNRTFLSVILKHAL
jgi:hypothetical protein